MWVWAECNCSVYKTLSAKRFGRCSKCCQQLAELWIQRDKDAVQLYARTMGKRVVDI